MKPRSIWMSVSLLCLSSCAGESDDADVDTEVQPSETIVEGETVVTTTGRDGRFFTTVIEQGELVFTLQTVRSDDGGGYRLDAELEPTQHLRRETIDVPVPDPSSAGGPKLEGISRAALYQLRTMRQAHAIEHGLPVAQDSAGCDGIGGSCGPWGACCDMHDKCLADAHSPALSTEGLPCNVAVAACFLGSTIPCGIAQIFGGGDGCKSECCDQGPLGNICGASCSDATPGGWYKWGNHACISDVIVNFFCIEQPNSYSCYKYDGRTATYSVVTDYACDTSETGYCNDFFMCESCPPWSCSTDYDFCMTPLDAGCNPPVYTAGSFMDQLCNGPLPTEYCRDDVCNGAEDCASCPEDCGSCEPVCGDEVCEGAEDCAGCAVDCGDCGGPHCADGACDGGESCATCEADCGACPPPVCGDDICNNGETCATCDDCGDCATCDDTCNGCGTTSGCGTSCGACPPNIESTYSTTPGGAPVVATITAPGNVALVNFNGVAGQRVSLRMNPVTIYSGYITIQTPIGTNLAGPAYTGSYGSFIDVVTLPMSGTYRIIVDPYGAHTGSATLTLYDVPPDPVTSITVGGAPVTVTTTTPGQNASMIFSGTAGQRVSVRMNPVTLSSAYVSIISPSGTVAGPAYTGIYGSFMDVFILPATGQYRLLLDGYGYSTGNATATLYDVPPDPEASITVGGPPVMVTTTTPGQNAGMTFTATAGQRISLKMNPVTMSSAYVTVRKPDGTTLVGPAYTGIYGSFIDVVTLPTSGTYTILVDGYAYYTGNVTITPYDVPPDPLGSITAGGAPAMVGMGTPGQNARLTFSGSSGQRVSVRMNPVTISSAYISILKPGGTTLVSPAYTGIYGSFIDVVTLPTSGTYTILVDGYGDYTGNVTVTLYDVPPDPAVPIPGYVIPTTVTLGTPGQNATLTFGGNAGSSVTLTLSDVSIASGYMTILKPDGSLQLGSTYFGTYGKTVTLNLTVTGIYTIRLDPYSYYTGSVTSTVI